VRERQIVDGKEVKEDQRKDGDIIFQTRPWTGSGKME